MEIPQLTVADDIGLDLTTDTIHNDKALASLIEQEAFMNEVLQVYVHPSSDEGAPAHFILNVNGINQPVFCGNVTPMRRKYVEVLARMKETKFTQPTMNLANPESSNTLIPRTVQVHPFEIRKDPNPLGRAWLNQVLAEAA